MKRLKYYLLNYNSPNYNELYEGKMIMPAGVNTEYHNDSTYWDGEIAYSITRTNKTIPDKPTVEIKIPIELIFKNDNMVLSDDLLIFKDVAADCMLRMFIPYIKELNDLNDNRSRTYKKMVITLSMSQMEKY